MKKEVKKESFGIKNINKESLLIGTIILLIGIVIGICLNMGDTFALETSASLSEATASNATDSNATSSNATTSNATTSNATDSNATSSNACINDNKLFLNEYQMEITEVEAGGRGLFRYNTSGACNVATVLYFAKEGNNNEIAFSATIEDTTNPYFTIPSSTAAGKYYLIEVLLYGLNSDGTTFTTYYSSINENADYFVDILNQYVNVTNNNAKVELKNISLSTKEAKIGDEVSIKLETSQKINSAKLIFKSQNNNDSFSTSVVDINNDPYFMIPSTVVSADYYLYQVVLTYDNNTTTYTYKEDLNFDIKLNVAENEKESYVYNNKDVNEEIIKKIYNSKNDTEISIDATENSIIDEDLFNTIKGTRKKLIINYEDNYIVFCGNDIENPKTIDAKMTINLVEKTEELNEIVDSGIVVNFESNGNLPGSALVKVKITDEMKNLFGNDNIYVYYYDETNEGFNLIESNVKESDGYYEFNISHNSKYILVKNKLDDSLIIEEEDNNIVGFQMSNKMYLLMIAGGLILILITTIIILKSKKKTKKEDKEVQKEKIKKENDKEE